MIWIVQSSGDNLYENVILYPSVHKLNKHDFQLDDTLGNICTYYIGDVDTRDEPDDCSIDRQDNPTFSSFVLKKKIKNHF